MSNFPFPWWDKTFTLYNKLVDPDTKEVSWYRTVLENCFWKYVNNTFYVGVRGISTSGLSIETKNVICRIPKDDRFVDRKTWFSLNNNERAECFTLGNGDIIVLGEVEDEINEYEKGKRSTDLVMKYKELDGCIEVETYVLNTGTGVGMEHYRIIGA